MIEHPQTLFADTKTYSSIELNTDKTAAQLAVVFEGNNPSLSPQESDQLFKILAALKVTENDVALFHAPSAMPSIASIKKQLGVKYIIAFTSTANSLGANLQLPLYEVVNIDDVKVLRSKPLSKIMADVEHKKVLWAKLQQMFGL